MSEILTERQQNELKKAVFEWLEPKLKMGVLFEVEKALDLPENVEIPIGYLEKKWSTVLRLQKRIIDLEDQMDLVGKENRRLLEMISNGNTENINLIDQDINNNIEIQHQNYINKLNWIPNELKASLRYQTGSIMAIAIHPFKPILASSSQNGDIVIWNLIDLTQPIKIIPNAHSRSINDLEFQPNLENSLLCSCSSDQSIKLWDISSNEYNNMNDIPIMTLTGHQHIVSTIKFRNSNELISCSRDKSIKIWDLSTGLLNSTIIGHSDWVRNLSIINKDWLISCSNDTSIRLTFLPLLNGIGLCLNDQIIEDIEFLPMESNIYLDKFLTLLNKELNYKEFGYKYCISVDRSKMIKIWLLPIPIKSINGNFEPSLTPNGICIYEFKGHKSWIKSISIHPNGRFFCTGSDDGFLKIWDLKLISNGKFGLIKELNQGKSSFVNKVKFLKPILTNDQRSLNERMRCFLISCGSDELINIWI